MVVRVLYCACIGCGVNVLMLYNDLLWICLYYVFLLLLYVTVWMVIFLE